MIHVIYYLAKPLKHADIQIYNKKCKECHSIQCETLIEKNNINKID